MNIYYMPINLRDWNLFKKNVEHIENFRYKTGMRDGDMLLLYVTQKGIDDLKQERPIEYNELPTIQNGIFGVARVIGKSYISKDPEDYLYGEEVIDAKISHLCKTAPIISLIHSPKGQPYALPQEVEVSVTKL